MVRLDFFIVKDPMTFFFNLTRPDLFFSPFSSPIICRKQEKSLQSSWKAHYWRKELKLLRTYWNILTTSSVPDHGIIYLRKTVVYRLEHVAIYSFLPECDHRHTLGNTECPNVNTITYENKTITVILSISLVVGGYSAVSKRQSTSTKV